MSAAASEGHMALAKKLASNTGKTRDKAMHQLRAWLIKRKDMDDLDLLKVWKGLFYCFWMSDKPQVQFELAQRISGLLLPLQDDRTVQFMKAFFVTMNREWGGIDRLRLDKYMKLVRQMVFHAFKTLQQRQFKEEVVTAMAKVFIEHALDWKNAAQRGIFLHVADILLAEASKVSAEGPVKMPFAVLECFLDPIFATLAECKDSSLVKRVNSVVFNQLLAAAALPSEEDEERSEEDAALHAILKGNIDTIAKKLFKLASDKATSEKLRPNIYALREKFQQIQADHEEKAMAVDSDEEVAPPPALKKKGKRKHEEEEEEQNENEAQAKKSTKQSKKGSKQKQQTPQSTPVVSETPADKKNEKKQQKQRKQDEEVKEETKQSLAEVENKKEKKNKKNKKQRTEAVVEEKQAEEEDDEKQEHHLSKEQLAKAMTHYPTHVPSPKKTHTKMQIKGRVHTDVQSSDGTSITVDQDVDVEMALTSPHSKKNKKKGAAAAVAPLTPSTVAAITSNLFSFAVPSSPSSDAPTTPRSRSRASSSSSSSTPSHTRVKFSVNGSPHVQIEQDPATPSRDKTLPPPVTPGTKKGVWFSLEDNQVKEFDKMQRLQNMDVKGMLSKPSPGPKIKPAKLPIRINTYKSPMSAAAAANAKKAAQTGSAQPQRRQASSYF